MTLDIVHHADLPLLIAKGLDGDHHAILLMAGAGHFARQFESAPLSCEICHGELRRGEFALAIWADLSTSSLSTASCIAICTLCAPAGDTALATTLALTTLAPKQTTKIIGGPLGYKT